MNQSSGRKRRSWLAIVVAFSMLVQLAVVMQPRTALAASGGASAGVPSLADIVQVKLDGGAAQLMKLYANGMYEAAFTSVAAGNHTYSVYVNGNAVEENTAIALPLAQNVYVRYSPIQSDKVIDSVNESTSFQAPAAWVGNFSAGLGSYLAASISDWAPGDANAFLTYQGGGIYSRTFPFNQPLSTDVALQYKVAFGGDWSHPNIGDNGGNIAVTIPAGTPSLTIWADAVNGVAFDSVRGARFSANQGAGNPRYEADAGTVQATLGLSENGAPFIYNNFTQLSESLYAYTVLLPAGNYTFDAVFDAVHSYQNGATQPISLAADTTVTFLYDASQDKLMDSVHDESAVAEKLNFPLPPAPPPVSSGIAIDSNIADRVEASVDGGSKQLLKLYYNGVYEVTLGHLAKGNHTYTVYYNDQVLENGTISVPNAQDVFLQFRPFLSNNVMDSINDRASFRSPAAWVGDFSSGLNNYLPTALNDWSPGDANSFLTYQGGGIYSRTFTFNQPLAADVALNYKVAFGGDWSHGNIGNNGANITVTIPAGTQSMTVWADSVNMTAFDSISGTPFHSYQGAGNPRYEKPAGTVNAALALALNGGPATSSNLAQVGPSLYAYTALLAPGVYSYQAIFDSLHPYQNGGTPTFTLSQDTVVTFLYDASNDQLVDSVNSPELATAMIGLTAPIDLNALDQQAYKGNDLGAVYTPDHTQFKVWAPTASKVQLKLYSTGDANDNSVLSTENMQKQDNGIWVLNKAGNLKGAFYTYFVTVGLKTNETVDLYAKAVGINGNRAMVVDLNDTNPDGWNSDQHVAQKKITDAVIWETHVRDFSSDRNSGISDANRGKYLAFTETGTTLKGEGKVATGVDHLKQLGVNYIQLLPVFDYDNFNGGEASDVYNWGYNPKNYNVPEGSYSSDPANGITRIKEFKQMVQGLHKADIGVIMDVVYNHTGLSSGSWFNLTVPDYYYRHNEDGSFSNGSGTDNETASERAMFRKFMVESVLYWAQQYHVDGFRFDLMALHDVDTMNAIRKALNEAGLSNVLMYGEPWKGGPSAMAANVLPANKANAKHLDNGIAVFNDDLRDVIKGYVFDPAGKGFAQGGNVSSPIGTELVSREYADSDLIAGIQSNSNPATASNSSWTKEAWLQNPSQSINYISVHDDLSLWDKLVGSVNGIPSDHQQYADRDDNLVAINKIAAAANLTSQGVAFFQAGEEFARTKLGDHNSYQSPIAINQIDWSRLETFADLNRYYEGLIQIRKQYDLFRDATGASVQNMVFSEDGKENVVAYTVQDATNTIAVLLNATTEEQTVTLKTKNGRLPADWTILANKDNAGLASLGLVSGGDITIPAQSAMVLAGKQQSGGGTIEGGSAGGGLINPNASQVANGKIIVASKLDGQSNQATAIVSSEDIKQAASDVSSGAYGTKRIPIEVLKAEGATAYAVELPVSTLTEASAASEYAIATALGTVVVPSNLLISANLANADHVSLFIGIGDKSSNSDKPSIVVDVKVNGAARGWSNPDARVTIAIPYEPTDEEKADPEHIVIWQLVRTGKAVPVPTGKYDAASGKVVFTTPQPGQYVVAYVHKTFEDIEQYAWAKQAIEVMASKGVINGTSATTFSPSAAVKRADFILLLVKALGLSGKAEGNFADVGDEAYYAEAVAVARKLGIATGIGNNQFDPDGEISRQEMMTMVTRAMHAANKELATGTDAELTPFADKDSIAAYAVQSAATLVKNGIVTGDGLKINPLGHTTRAEAAVLIYRIYN
ncbi:type I pullulanase [Paenibacillus curdlanolyticus]|nr:type I pullulanase [Paenibacillus curdlanolyticus]